MTQPEPLEPDAILNRDGSDTASPEEMTAGGRPLYWHVFGGAINGATRGSNNFALITAGPVTRPAEPPVTETTLAGTSGEQFSYLGSFTHDPTNDDLTQLKPKAFR